MSRTQKGELYSISVVNIARRQFVSELWWGTDHLIHHILVRHLIALVFVHFAGAHEQRHDVAFGERVIRGDGRIGHLLCEHLCGDSLDSVHRVHERACRRCTEDG